MLRRADTQSRFIAYLMATAIMAVMTTVRDASAQRAGSIDTISPPAARVGELVTIKGRGFGAFNVRVTVGGVPAVLTAANGSQVTFRVPDGAAGGTTQVAATNPGGQSGSIAFRVLEGILLPGNPDGPALTAITNRPPTAANESDIQNGVILTRLEIYFAHDATVADVNAVLHRIDGGIVSMSAGSTGLSVAVPRQNDLAALQVLADTVKAMHGVRFAAPGQAKQPLSIFVGTDIPTARHLLPSRLPAAWNAKALLANCGSNRVPILVPDYYGPPPAAFSSLFPNLGDVTGGIPTTMTHGYKVISTLADPGPPSPSAGANPFLDCLDLRPVQIADVNAIGVQDKLALNFPGGKFIVSMSLGDTDFCEDQGSKVDCTPGLAAAITTPLERAYRALRWKTLTQSRWSDFLMVAAAGNSRDTNLSGGAIYPGVTQAANENEVAVAAQPDPFFTFAANPAQWTPAQYFLDQGFVSNTATDSEMATLRSDVVAAGLDASVEDNALIVGATTNLSPPNDAAMDSPGYNLVSEASFSNSAPDVKMVGVSVPDVCTGLPCPTINGTSFATPQVAGLASYLWLLSPTLRSQPAQTTRQAILQNTVNGMSVSGIVDAYAAMLSLDAAQLPTPQSAPVRLALLDVKTDGVFDEQDLALFVQHYFTQNSDGSLTAVAPTAADFSRYDLNGDGYTGGPDSERFDLDRVGSTQFGRTKYSMVTQSIENEDMTYDEQFLTDVDILCYYAYSDLYTGHTDARRDLLAGPCGVGVKVTVNPGGATVAAGNKQQFSVTVTGATDPRVTWTATGGAIDATGLFTAGATSGLFTVRATSVADPRAFGEATVTITSGSIAGVFLGTGPHNGNGPLVFQGTISFVDSNGLPINTTSFEWPITDVGGFIGHVNTLVAGVSRFAVYTISIGNTLAPVSLSVSLSAPVGNLSVGGSTCGSTFTVSAADVDMLNIQPQCHSTATVNVHDVNGNAWVVPDHSTVTLNAQNIGLGQANRGALFIGCAFTFGCVTVQSSTVTVQAAAFGQVSVTASNSSIKVNGQVQPWNVPGQCGINGSDAGCIPGIFLQGNSNTDLRAQLSGNVSFFLLDNNAWNAAPQISIGDEVVARDPRTTNLGLVSITNNRGLVLGGINGLDQITGDLRITGNIGFDDSAANTFANGRSVQGSVTISQNSGN